MLLLLPMLYTINLADKYDLFIFVVLGILSMIFKNKGCSMYIFFALLLSSERTFYVYLLIIFLKKWRKCIPDALIIGKQGEKVAFMR
jgi:hypothetical protein